MIDRTRDLPVTRQTTLLGISRGSIDYVPRPVPESDLKLMRRIDKLHLAHPFMGARLLRDTVNREGFAVGMFSGRGVLYRSPRIDLPPLWRTGDCQHRPGRGASSSPSAVFLEGLTTRNIRISMDGKGAWRDNIVVEGLWRTVKYGEVYLKA